MEPVDAERPPALAAAGRLVHRDPVVLEHEVRDEVGEDQPRQDEDRVAFMPRSLRRATRRAAADPWTARRRPPWPAPHPPRRSRPAPGRAPRGGGRAPGRDDRHRRPAHPESLRCLGAPELVEQDQARDLALARRSARPAAPAAAGRGPRAARPPPDRRSRATRPSRCTRARPIASRAARNAGPVRSVAGPLPACTSPATTAQRSSRASGWSAARRTARNGSAPGASSSWSSSPWVNPAGASRGSRGTPPRARRAAPAGTRRSRGPAASRRRRRTGRSPGPGRHPSEPTRWPDSRLRLIDRDVAVSA